MKLLKHNFDKTDMIQEEATTNAKDLSCQLETLQDTICAAHRGSQDTELIVTDNQYTLNRLLSLIGGE